MSFVAPILFVIITWWVGTGVVLYLQQRISRVRTGLIITLAMVSIASLFALLHGSSGTQAWQSYLGFMAAISLWGCIELSYYTGLIGGVHKRSCPANCNTGKRFRLALGASIWHEITVLFAGALVIALLYDASNPAGLYSFLVLWLMRWSAKLNLFFGMPNFNTDWFPKRLTYAHSYIRRSPVTWFFPLSMLIASFVAAKLLSSALAHPPEHSLMMILPGMLILLAILEHVFMALPIADSELWNKIFTRDDADDQQGDDDNTPLLTQAGSPRIQAVRTQKCVDEVVTLSTSRKTAVALHSVDVRATPSVSQ